MGFSTMSDVWITIQRRAEHTSDLGGCILHHEFYRYQMGNRLCPGLTHTICRSLLILLRLITGTTGTFKVPILQS